MSAAPPAAASTATGAAALAQQGAAAAAAAACVAIRSAAAAASVARWRAVAIGNPPFKRGMLVVELRGVHIKASNICLFAGARCQSSFAIGKAAQRCHTLPVRVGILRIDR